MRNLELFYHSSRRFEEFNTVQHFCVNPLENAVYIYEDGYVYCISHDTVEVLNLREHCNEELSSKVVGMGFSCALGALCLGTERGALLSVAWSSRGVEVVGGVAQGLRCMQWSPDEELLLLVTGDDTVLAMSMCWDLLWEQPLWQEGFGAAQPVNVGWGKKETQFHGSEGKAARSLGAAKVTASTRDDGSVRVSWRGDGMLVAISGVNPEICARCIRIFNREGMLQATSEPVMALEMSLAWRPTGNLIASVQELPNKYQVVFFEKNGLRHGEFTLPFGPGKGVVRQLAWGASSDVLSVWYEDDTEAHLLICTVANYHWYVKQDLTYPLKNRLWACIWDHESPLKMHVLYGSGRYCVYNWVWNVTSSSPYAENNRAEVAVIDNNKVMLTAFAEKIVPPPMCGEQLTAPKGVNQVVFGPPSISSNVLLVLIDGRISLFEGQERALRWTQELLVDIPGVEGPYALHHWLWVSEKMLVAVATVGVTSRLVRINLQQHDGKLHAEDVGLDVEGVVLTTSLVGDGGNSEVVVQMDRGDLLVWKVGRDDVPSQLHLLQSCSERLLKVCAWGCPHGEVCTLGLSSRSRLFLKGKEVASNITSFHLLPPNRLLLTNSAHRLLTLELRYDQQSGSLTTSVSEAVSRRVERGSRLVTAANSSVVLQMPRGNLEVVTPRALVLHQVARDLDLARFTSVFVLCRKQRINLNILVDHNPDLFLTHVEDFVREMKASWLSLFVVELSEEDITRTSFATFYHSQPAPPSPPWLFGNKRKVVCERLCEAMSKAPGCEALLLPRLSALTVGGGRGEVGLQSALRTLLSAADTGEPDQASGVLDAGVHHLLTLCDAKVLYRSALATYDLRLAARIAARSSSDPKEYLPFLNELQRLDEVYRCYRIDAHLNHWESALVHLARCEDRVDEFLALTQKHSLYAPALELFAVGEDRYKEVAALYGEYLLKERKLEEATIMLRRAGQVEDALEAARLAGDWQQALELLMEARWPAERRVEFLRRLAAVLTLQRRFLEASHILHRECGDSEEAVQVLVQARLWPEARLLATTARLDHFTGKIESGILEHFEQLNTEITTHRNSYESHFNRLKVVRAEKVYRPEENDFDGPESDLFSDTSSSCGSGAESLHSGRSSRSGRSSGSGRSGKNRRKQERKLMNLKEGSRFEDLALLRAMHQLVTTCYALRREVREVCVALLGLGSHDKQAAALQAGLSGVLDAMEGTKDEVWIPALCSPNLKRPSNEQYGPETTVNSIVTDNARIQTIVQNCELLDPRYRIPPQVQEHINWKLSILNL